MAVCAGQLKRTMIILLCVTTSAWAASGDDSLPPPPDAQTMNNDAIFQLSVVINHYDTGLVVPVTQRNGTFLSPVPICCAPVCRLSRCRRVR